MLAYHKNLPQALARLFPEIGTFSVVLQQPHASMCRVVLFTPAALLT